MARFMTPVPSPISQQWGESPDYYRRHGQQGHTGIDYASPVGTPIKASADGVIEFAGNGARHSGFLSTAGTAILIDHNTVYTGYAHLSQINVVKGQRVKQGDTIGLTGSTGEVTGPHLHFEFWGKPTNWNNGWSGRINPNDYLSKEEKKMVEDNQVHFDTMSQIFYDMTGDKLGRQEFNNACLNRPWDEALRNLSASDRVKRWEQWALAGKNEVQTLRRQLADLKDRPSEVPIELIDKAVQEAEDALAAVKALKGKAS